MAFTIERCTCKLKPYLVTDLFIRAIMTLKISILPSTVGKCSFILNNSLNHFVPRETTPWILYIQSYSYAQTSDLTIKL